MQGGGEFTYSSQPHAAPVKRANKYRDDGDGGGEVTNIMHDPRVIRGNTHSAKIMTSTLDKDPGNKSARSTNSEMAKRKFGARPGQPRATPPSNSQNINTQTGDFLEELTDRPIDLDADTQTQQLLDRPASPIFVKGNTGKDAETQICPGDLFNFELEVEPLLEILVGKTLHVAVLELMQEDELEAIRLQQEEYEALRNVELAEVKRLEAESKRKNQEREKRIQQERKRVADKKELEQKIAARSFAHQYLGTLHATVFEMMEEQGLFYDPVKKEVEEVFMKNIMNSLHTRSSCYHVAAELAEELLEEARSRAREFEITAVRLREELHARREHERAVAERLRLAAEAEERRLAELALQAEEL